MTITYPLNLLAGFPGWTIGFDLRWRPGTEHAKASGRVLVKDMGAPLWTLRATTKVLSPNNLDQWRARLTSLENGLQTFLGYSMSRCFPILYPNGTWPTGVAFNGTCVFERRLEYRRPQDHLAGRCVAGWLCAGNRSGDYISIAGDLHQVMETATASGSGITNAFEVRPHLWPDVTAPTPGVLVKQPSCTMAIVPGSIASDASLSGWGTVSFQAIEARL